MHGKCNFIFCSKLELYLWIGLHVKRRTHCWQIKPKPFGSITQISKFHRHKKGKRKTQERGKNRGEVRVKQQIGVCTFKAKVTTSQYLVDSVNNGYTIIYFGFN